MANNLVTIAQFTNYIEAEIAKQILDDFGIESVISGENASNIFSGISAIEGPELQVLESNVEKARQILESDNKQEQEQ